jgi:hypothetical protein
VKWFEEAVVVMGGFVGVGRRTKASKGWVNRFFWEFSSFFGDFLGLKDK